MAVKEDKVSVSCEEGVVLYINASSKKDATKKAEDIDSYYAGTTYPSDYAPNHVHRHYFINDVEKN